MSAPPNLYETLSSWKALVAITATPRAATDPDASAMLVTHPHYDRLRHAASIVLFTHSPEVGASSSEGGHP